MFNSDADLQRADWPLLQNGAVNLFYRQEYLMETRKALSALEYEFADITCRDGFKTFQQQLSSLLQWRQQFGYEVWNGNLNALNDGLRGYPFGSSGRAALVLDGYHKIASSDPDRGYAILDRIEVSARNHLLWGNTLIALVQTDDPNFECANIGARSAQWNAKEWLTASRGV